MSLLADPTTTTTTTTTTTPEGDVTTLSDQTESGGSGATTPGLTKTNGYTTGHASTTGQGRTTETGHYTDHSDTTLQVDQDTTHLQTTTIPPADQLNDDTRHSGTTTTPSFDYGDTTTGPHTDVTPLLENHISTHNTEVANRTFHLQNDTSTDYTTTETAISITSQVFNSSSTSTDSSMEYPTDNNRTLDEVNRKLISVDNATEQTTVSTSSTSIMPPSTDTWNHQSNNEKDDLESNGTSYESNNNNTSTDALEEILQSGSGDYVPFETQTKTSPLENSKTSTTDIPYSVKTSVKSNTVVGNISPIDSDDVHNYPIQNTTSSGFEGIQTLNRVNISITYHQVESNSEEVEDIPEMTTTPLLLNEASMTVQNISTYSTDNGDGVTTPSTFNTPAPVQSPPGTDILRETINHNTSPISTLEELYTSPSDVFTESTAIPLRAHESPVVQTVQDPAIVEADHAKTNRSEREIIVPPQQDLSPDAKNTAHVDHPLGTGYTTLQIVNSTLPQSSPGTNLLGENDTSIAETTEDTIKIDILIQNPTHRANDDPADVLQNVSANTDGSYDNFLNTTLEEDQNQQQTDAFPTGLTDAVPEAETTVTVSDEDAVRAMYSTTLEPIVGTTMTPQEDSTTSRSIILDALRHTSVSDDTEKTTMTREPDQQTTEETPEAAAVDEQRTTVLTTSSSTTTKSPLVEVISRQDLRFVIQPRNQSVRLGQSVVFECVTDPPSYITWYVHKITFVFTRWRASSF